MDEDDGRKELLAQIEAQKSQMTMLLAQQQNSKTQEQQKLSEEQQQQRKEYAARGISLAFFDEEKRAAAERAHFVNIDADPFRSKRFFFFVKNKITRYLILMLI